VLERHRSSVERVDLLRRDPRNRRRLVLGIARRDAHLGAVRALTLAHQLGDLPRQRLRAEWRL
jgi:hypothetical protein